ncbi:helix-hairpin-helix domain-containing protein [Enterococcus rivorum]|uniref:Helix-hairpin-helix DNA-binding motif class 1 domain-containing protein n=1 Tax=Enterococcus rivorum TaxID=762845 RepID=A0A1E5KWQ1_9ENTE|nr:helix-hairpin-helix domain-containing protein [Enterococcus rivorum]MBP2100141.1 competence protein ComEA [Enterococcus rivorum]OEH82069.1 hypothetical protein BCR26_14520 [Enterococcus rivorum]
MLLNGLVRKYKYYILGGIVGILILMVTIIWLLRPSEKNEAEFSFQEESTTVTNESSKQIESTKQIKKEQNLDIFVDVKGAVKNPGMYEVQGAMRVWDVVGLAGGVKENADTKQVNFSQRISDQMVIYIPVHGEVLPEILKEVSNENNQDKENNSTMNKIDLNKASETELQALTGVGGKKAQEIIRYREQKGGFKSVEDLKNISGIGEKTFEKLKDQITVS